MGARACQVFCRSWGHCQVFSQKWPCVAVRRVFASFRFSFSTPFSQTSSAPLHTPLFLFRCFCLLFALFLGLGAAPHCTCVFWAVGLHAFFVGFFLLQKHCFPPEKGGILVHFSVSLFLLGFFHFSFSLSLSVLFFVFLPCFLCCFFLPCLFCFCFMKNSKDYI